MLEAGQQVGSYLLRSPLGAGGFSTVWRAEGRQGETVALKVLRRELLAPAQQDESGPTFVERFLREARIIQKLQHPGLTEIYEVIDDRQAGLVAYAMELLQGHDLAALAGSISLAELLIAHARIADTLAYLHDHGVIHRDVKPENIFVLDAQSRRPGGVEEKLLDFGIAKELYATSRLDPTATGVLLGTIRAMPPDSFRAKAEPTPAIDQWGIGISLFWCLAGRPPFDDVSFSKLVAKIEHEPTPPLVLREHFGLDGVPAGLDAIVRRCLEKRPENRFDSMTALAEALRGAHAIASAQEETLPPPKIDGPDQLRPTVRMQVPAELALPPTVREHPPPPVRASYLPILIMIVALAVLFACAVLYWYEG